jgi:Uma2 family endonuclease
LSVDQYRRMVELGLFSPRDKVELLEGLIVDKMTRNTPHAVASDLIVRVLARVVPEGWFTSIETPVSLPDSRSVPEPDAKVVRGNPRDYSGRWHGPGDAALVIEIADTSYAEDRSRKLRLYAESLVPVYWILDLNGRRLEVFSDPTGPADQPRYLSARSFRPGRRGPPGARWPRGGPDHSG